MSNERKIVYKCNVCGPIFDSLEGCKKHVKVEHYATANPEKYCDKIEVQTAKDKNSTPKG